MFMIFISFVSGKCYHFNLHLYIRSAGKVMQRFLILLFYVLVAACPQLYFDLNQHLLFSAIHPLAHKSFHPLAISFYSFVPCHHTPAYLSFLAFFPCLFLVLLLSLFCLTHLLNFLYFLISFLLHLSVTHFLHPVTFPFFLLVFPSSLPLSLLQVPSSPLLPHYLSTFSTTVLLPLSLRFTFPCTFIYHTTTPLPPFLTTLPPRTTPSATPYLPALFPNAAVTVVAGGCLNNGS